MTTADALTRLHRKPDRGSTERAALDDVLDSVLVGTLATVVDGLPWAVPLLYARVGDAIVLHGSTGAGALRQVAAGAPACFTVARMDGLVVADTLFEHSANYRSAVVRGELQEQSGDAHWDALRAMSDRLLPGRPDEVVEMTRKELAATTSLLLPIVDGQWIVKARTGLPGEPESDPQAWCGTVELHEVWGEPQPAPWQPADRPVPESVRRLGGNRR